MLEIKNAVVVVIFIFLEHNGLWKIGRFKLFLHRGIIPCLNFRVHVTPFACM